MTSGLEAVGDVATGAVLAGVVEPHGGKDGEGGHGKCANCGATLVGAYCHDCGQNSHIHRTLTGFGHDLLHGVFHFEGKIWHTLPLLFLKPGELTRRYVHGERARFVSPLAGFLFCTFLMFAVVGGIGGEMHLNPRTTSTTDKLGNLNINMNSPQALQDEIDKTQGEIKALKAKIRIEDKADRETKALESRLDELEDKANALDKVGQLVPGIKTRGNGGKPAVFGFHTNWPVLDQGIDKANENPNLFLYRLQSSAYKYSWALIPLSTPLVWLLFFWKRQYKFYDHLVFVTFSLTFMTVLVTLLTVLGALGVSGGLIALAAMIVPPLHMYRQLRGAYQIGRISALLRTAALVVMSGVALLLYMLGLLALGVFH
jgi:hypothetical protein